MVERICPILQRTPLSSFSYAGQEATDVLRKLISLYYISPLTDFSYNKTAIW